MVMGTVNYVLVDYYKQQIKNAYRNVVKNTIKYAMHMLLYISITISRFEKILRNF